MNSKDIKEYRQRLIEKYNSVYTTDFSRKEIIDLLMLTVCPQKDPDKTSKRLIDRLGADFVKIIDSPPHEIMKAAGLSAQTAEFIHMIPKIARIYKHTLQDADTVLKEHSLGKYAINLMLHRKEEVFYLISLNRSSKIIAENIISQGSATSVSINLKELSRVIISSNAAYVVLVHNHPGGSTKPSQEDIAITDFLVKYIRGLNVITLDHIIVNNEKFYSMRHDKPHIFLSD